jgi:hypothetical protein
MESTLQNPTLVADRTIPKADTIGFWIFTALFCVQIGFTTGVRWGLSYFFWRRVQATSVSV